jgi:enoyl-CoA hydratase
MRHRTAVEDAMTVRIEKNGFVTTVVNDRINARNACDPETSDALHQAFLDFEADENARVAVFWGAGGAFCAGWDLKSASSLEDPERFESDIVEGLRIPEGDEPWTRGPMGPTRLQLTKPVIAAIEGPAVAGGMELALWCDMRVMAENAYFGVYCRRWGVPLIDGGTVRLPRLVGVGRALDIVLTGRKVPAEEAHRIGLCERVVRPGEARAAAEAMAQEIARFPQGAVRADRLGVYASHGFPTEEALRREWAGGLEALRTEGLAGAARFASGLGRSGDFERI